MGVAGLIIARRLGVIEFLCENEIISIQKNVITYIPCVKLQPYFLYQPVYMTCYCP